LQIYTGEKIADIDAMRGGPRRVQPEDLDDPEFFELPRLGIRTRVLFLGEGPDGFSVLAVDLAPHAIIYRHAHDTDCLYSVTEGHIVMGRRRIEQGGGFFVAANQPYTYQAGPEGACVAETRATTTFRTTVMETNPGHRKAIVENARTHRTQWEEFFEARDAQVAASSS
jgi:hypothetical protein